MQINTVVVLNVGGRVFHWAVRSATLSCPLAPESPVAVVVPMCMQKKALCSCLTASWVRLVEQDAQLNCKGCLVCIWLPLEKNFMFLEQSCDSLLKSVKILDDHLYKYCQPTPCLSYTNWANITGHTTGDKLHTIILCIIKFNLEVW